MLSHPIALEIVVPNVTPKITRTCAHLKSVTRAELFPGLEIFQMHDQYDFGLSVMIYVSRTLVC